MKIEYVRAIAQQIAEKTPASPNTAIISITSPGMQACLLDGWPMILRLQFLDGQYDDREIMFWEKAWPVVSSGMVKKEHTVAILNFIRQIEASDTINSIVVHCHAGRSRSASIAHYIAEQNNLPIDPSWKNYNRTVYTLLRNPARYDYAYRENHSTFIDKLKNLWRSVR